MPKVSVLMPSYNHEKFIADAIESVMNQSFQDWELVITDDGSSDGTLDIVKQYAREEERIKFFAFDENKGASVATNNSLSHAKGEYIAIINSDDIWVNVKLEKQIKFLDLNKNVAAVFSKVNIIDEESVRIKPHPFESVFNKVENKNRHQWLNFFFFQGNCLCHPSILVRKKCYDKLGFYKNTLASLPDFDMWVRLCMQYNIHIMDEKLIAFRVLSSDGNESAATVGNAARCSNEAGQILVNYLEIETPEDFLRVFTDNEKFYDRELIPFYLAKQSLRLHSNSVNFFGLNLLYKIFSSNENAKFVEKKTGFSFKNLHKLSHETDSFLVSDLASFKIRMKDKLKNHLFFMKWIFLAYRKIKNKV